MDYSMPTMDGPSATQEIRKLKFRGKIYGLTGQMQEEEVSFFYQSGADEVFGKPLDMSRFKAICESLVQKRLA